MFAQLIPFIALATLLVPVPTRAVPGPAWIRRQQDAQSSLTLDPAVISHGLEQDGQGNNPDPGQVRSLTSSNNFINFCLPFLDQGVVLTNGAQVTAGSCNQTPMGRIISLDVAPRCKFVFPKNGDDSLVENQAFTVQMKLLNLEAGNFVNANTNYYAAPQQVNDQGIVIGHSHVVIEPIPSLQSTEPLDPLKFAFFKGVNDPVDSNNLLSTTVSAGLPAGIYRMCSINTAANHQPALVSNAQHGALDDCSYFTVKSASGANATETASGTETASSTSTTESVTDTASAGVADVTSTSTDAAQATATDSATATGSDAATTTDPAAADTASATQSATAGTDAGSSSDNQDAQAATTSTADATTSTDASVPAATESASTSGDSQNNNGGNNNDGNNGGDNTNNGNNGGDNNNGNDNNNNRGGNDNNNGNGDNSSDTAAPTATDSSTPADDSAATSTPDAATSTTAPDASSTQSADDGNNNGNSANDNQGGSSSDDAASSTI